MSSTWIAIVLSACTLCGGLAVVASNGDLATLVKVLYAVCTLGLAACLALHETDTSGDRLDPAPLARAPMAPDATNA